MANESNPKASLGCGTLILIALIVLFLGNANNDDKVVNEIRNLKQQIARLEAQPRSQSETLNNDDQVVKEIRDLKQQINRLEDQLRTQSETLKKLTEQRLPRPRIIAPATPEQEATPVPEN